MSACSEFEELLSAKLDGELTAEEAGRLEAHLAGCEVCRREYARLERVWEALDVLDDIEVSADLADRVFKRAVGASRSGHRIRRSAKWFVPAAAAAGVLVAVLVGQLRPTQTPTPIEPETRQIVTNLEVLDNLELLENLDMLEAMGDDFSALQTLDAFSDEEQESQS